MKPFAPLAIVALLLTGCDGPMLQTYVGRSIEWPILEYGPPDLIFELHDNHRAYQWALQPGAVSRAAPPVPLPVPAEPQPAPTLHPLTTYVPPTISCYTTFFTVADRHGGWIVERYHPAALRCH